MSGLWNVRSMKYPVYEMSGLWNVCLWNVHLWSVATPFNPYTETVYSIHASNLYHIGQLNRISICKNLSSKRYHHIFTAHSLSMGRNETEWNFLSTRHISTCCSATKSLCGVSSRTSFVDPQKFFTYKCDLQQHAL